jgi:hypothetical protein
MLVCLIIAKLANNQAPPLCRHKFNGLIGVVQPKFEVLGTIFGDWSTTSRGRRPGKNIFDILVCLHQFIRIR